jgi:taurine--2-oxoglutarate transaminase
MLVDLTEEEVVPDLITFAKRGKSGDVPLGGVAISERIAATFDQRTYPGGATCSGHPLACAARVASIHHFEEVGLLGRVGRVGEELVAPRLRRLQARHASVGELRSRGLTWTLELVRGRGTREMLVRFSAPGRAHQPMARLAAACREGGVWPFIHFNPLHVAPPLIISD